MKPAQMKLEQTIQPKWALEQGARQEAKQLKEPRLEMLHREAKQPKEQTPEHCMPGPKTRLQERCSE
jgi:hypothetical protein